MSKKEELYKALLEQVKELCTFYWELDDPRSNPLSFEIGAVETIMHLIQDEEKKDLPIAKTSGVAGAGGDGRKLNSGTTTIIETAIPEKIPSNKTKTKGKK